MNPDGSVDGERLLNVLRRTPGSTELIMLGHLIEKGELAPEYQTTISEIVGLLSMLILLADEGIEQCQIQIEAIKKLAHPNKYEIPINKIIEIANYETSPTLARAWELRRIMSHLTNVVVPRHPTKPFTHNQIVRMRTSPAFSVFQALWDLARKHWNPNSTLQSLAIDLYLIDLDREGVTCDARTLKKDLQHAREWEHLASEDEKALRGLARGATLGDLSITWYEFSEGWKTKAKNRKAKKGTSEVSNNRHR